MSNFPLSETKWVKTPLGEVVKFLSGGTPRKSREEYWNGDIPWAGSGELAVERLHDTELHISEEGGENGSRVVPAGTVLVVVRGMSLAKEFRVSLTMRRMAFNQDLKAIVPTSVLTSDFLFYFLLSCRETIREKATEASHGTKKLELDVLKEHVITIPPLDMQQSIVEMLAGYDDLLANNRRRMALLEESARRVYREWFIHLRAPGLRRSANGLPKGWTRCRIGDIADCVGGGTPSTGVAEYWDGGDVTWVTPTDVTRNAHFILLDSAKKITRAGLAGSSAKLVPPHAVLMTSRASVGYFALARREVCTNQGFISIVPENKKLSNYLLFQLSDRVEDIRLLGSGSTFPEVSRTKFRDFQVLLPTAGVIEQFDEFAEEILSQIHVLKRQNENLRAARDLLLPRLMSGELEIPASWLAA